ncbi:hypothetical protein [Halorubrum distributum]|nr:hypothetical protein [Halorubrum arcis]
MPAMSIEAILGWLVIGGFFYVLGEYTDLFAYVFMYPKKAGRKLRGAATTDRVLGAGGLVGGLWFGPVIWEIAATAFAGFLGGASGVIALDALGFQLSGGELAAVGVVAVLAWAGASTLATEEDDD